MPEPTITLSDEQVAFFRENGYLAIEAITTPEEIARLREVYDRLFAERAGREEGNQFDLAGSDEDGQEAALPQILTPSRYAPELAETLYRANAAAISRQLLGDDATFQGDHAILKPARHGAPTPWHQDEAYWAPELAYNALSVWMPLQEATLANGCLYFVPGSHRWEIVEHRPIGGDLRVHGLEVVDCDTSSAVACPLPPGGATFHHNRTLHYAPGNQSDTPRRAYILGFGAPPAKRSEPREFPWNSMKQTAREARAKRYAETQGG